MMEPVLYPALSRVVVCGGTHGNEMSGVHLVQEMQRNKVESVGSVPLAAMISNPRAVQERRRYVEVDINRCFAAAVLSSPVSDSTPYEVRRAQELNRLLGPKGTAEAVDLLCDLHNTTANMGLTVLSYSFNDWISQHIYMHIQRNVTSVPVRLILLNQPIEEAYSLESVGKHGLSIEVGPQPHGVVRCDIFNIMKEGVNLMLDWVERFHSGSAFDSGVIEAYSFEKSIDYPRDPDSHQITAAIHPELQDRDFCLLRPGDPVFLTFSGETVRYEEDEPLHPFFVNEGAYYEKGIAFHLGKKKTIKVPAVQVKRE